MIIKGKKTEVIEMEVTPFSVIEGLRKHYKIENAYHFSPGKMGVKNECLVTLWNRALIHGNDWTACVLTEDEKYIKLYDTLRELEQIIKDIENEKRNQ